MFLLNREHRWLYLTIVALLAALMALAYKFARPAVPSEVVMSTGGAGGAYEGFAKRYAAALAEEGITLKLVPSKGAVENLARLQDENSEFDLALIQNGLADRDKAEDGPLMSLGSMFYEPVLVFHRPEAFAVPLTSLAQLAGKRVAVGAEGSGTRALATTLLALHDLEKLGIQLSPDGGDATATALREGKLDAAIFVTNYSAPVIQALFADAKIRDADLALADTYARRLPQLTAVNLPVGVIDVPKLIPAQPVRTVAITSSLVAREDLHPAVVYLLIRAARKIHGSVRPIAKTNEFPSFSIQQDFPASPDAERVLREGVPWLYRYLPFKFANFVSRAIVFLIPLLAVLISLSDWIPKLMGMRVKSRLYAHYKDMKSIDEAIRQAESINELNAAVTRLDGLDAAVGRLKIPTNFSNEQFGIRDHMDLVRVRVERKREALSTA